MNHLFRINQFSPYAKTKDVALMRTIVRKRERNASAMFYDSRNQWDETGEKPRRKPYVNHEKRASKAKELQDYREKLAA